MLIHLNYNINPTYVSRVSNTESDEELRNRIQALVLAHVCQRYYEGNAIVTIEDLRVGLAHYFPIILTKM